MLNTLKFGVIMVLSISLLTISPEETFETFETPLSYIDEAYLTSNRMTQPDQFDSDRVQDYESLYQLPYTEEVLEELGFDYTLENDRYKLYFEPLSYSVVLYDKDNDYYVSSRAELQGLSGVRENNTSTRNLLNSGLWISYVRKANVTTASESTESVFTIADVEYVTDGTIRDEQDYFSVYDIVENSYDDGAVEVKVNKVNQTLETTVELFDLEMSVNVHLALNEDGLNVQIPASGLVETSDIYGLTKISVFPYFGAVRENLAPGYMLIPDGTGALIRFDDQIQETLRARFYGGDMGLNVNSRAYLSVPMAGLISHVDHQGYYLRVEEGDTSAIFEASFWSANSRYHRMSVTHTVRPIYRAIINQAGDGREQIPSALTTSDYAVTYVMLGEDANYSGISQHYQSHLLETNKLSEQQLTENMPMMLSFLMGDQTPAFLGTRYLEMTSSDDVLNIVDTLKDAGIEEMMVELYGWSRDGHVNETPYRKRYVGGVENLIETLLESNIPTALLQEYVTASSLSSRILLNRDVANNYSRLKMEYLLGSLNSQVVEAYMLFPDRSLAFANSDKLDHVSMPDIGNTLFSYYDDDFYTRADALNVYEEMLSSFETLMLHRPSLYAWQYMDAYVSMPMMHSNYYFYSDVVPFIPMLLKGIVPYFNSPLNFNALGDTMLLTMIDYGMAPNYILTEKPTETMRYTRSSIYFTTQFDVFKDDMVTNYERLNRIYQDVGQQKIVSRTMLALGVSQVFYEDGTSVVVNYTNNDYTLGAITIDARTAEVIE